MEINIDNLIEKLKEDGNTHQGAISLIFTASGMPAEKTAEEMYISTNTSRMHIRNSKDATGYNKSSELSGYVICKAFNIDYDKLVEKLVDLARSEVARRIMLSILIATTSYGLYTQTLDNRYFRANNKRSQRTQILARKNEA